MRLSLISLSRSPRPMLGVFGLLLAFALVYSLRPNTASTESHHRVFFPSLSVSRPGDPPSDAREFRERAIFGGATEALAILDDIAYVGFGNRLVIYDASEAGNAKRLGESEPVWGRIFEVEAGDDLLFVASRPDFDMEAFEEANPGWGGDLEELPAWNVLTVFDISDPRNPMYRSTFEFEYRMDYIVDMAAHERSVYVLLERSLYRDMPVLDSGTALWAIDASVPEAPTATELIEIYDMVSLGLAVEAGRLHVHVHGHLGQSFPVRSPRGAGVLSYDLKVPSEPSFIAFTAHPEFEFLTAPQAIAASGDRVFRIGEQDIGYLLTVQFDATGEPRLLGVRESENSGRRLEEWIPRLSAFGIDEAWQVHASIDERLYVLEPREEPAFLTILDVEDPLAPELLGQGQLDDLFLSHGIRERLDVGSLSDFGSDFDLIDDRLFIAAGDHAALVEIDAEDPSAPLMASQHPALGSEACAAASGDTVFLHRPELGRTDIFQADDEEAGRWAGIGTARTGEGMGCAIAIDGRHLYVSAGRDAGLAIFDVQDPTTPENVGQLALAGTVSRIGLARDLAYVLSDGAGLLIFDVADPAGARMLGRSISFVKAFEFALDGERLYVAAGDDGLAVVDVRDPERPEVLNRLDLGGSVETVTRHEERLFIGVRLPALEPDGSGPVVELVTAGVGPSPEVFHRRLLDPGTTELAMAADPSSDRLYVRSGERGLRIFDIAGPIPLDRGHIATRAPLKQLLAEDARLFGISDLGLRLLSLE